MGTYFDILKKKKQIILQGAPGTGKTYITAEIAMNIIHDGKHPYGNDRNALMNAYKQMVSEGRIAFTTFHQSMDYEEFVEGLRPSVDEGQITYNVEKGIFRQICQNADSKGGLNLLTKAIEHLKEISSEQPLELKTKSGVKFSLTYRDGKTFRVRSERSQAESGQDVPASIENIEKLYRGEEKGVYNKSYVWGILNYITQEWNVPQYSEIENHKNFILVIDEMNRGNVSKIFGELITLLEADKRIGEENEVRVRLPHSPEENFGVPSNLYIIGTMNTADRSVGHIDYAIRRRFAFITLKSDRKAIETFYDSIPNRAGENIKMSALNLFDKIYTLITSKISEEFDLEDLMIGHSYFMGRDKEELALKFEYEIKPLLKEYVKDGILIMNKDELNEIDALLIN